MSTFKKLIVIGCILAATDAFAANGDLAVDGSLGIGTTTPFRKVHIKGNSVNNSQVVSECNFPSHTPNAGGGFLGYFTVPDGTLPQANERLGYLMFGSIDGANPLNAAGVVARAESNWSKNADGITYITPAYLTFETGIGNAANDRAERMRVAGNGNVGIGTSAPNQKLEVNGGVRLMTNDAQPACNDGARGTFWVVRGTTDTVQVCVQGTGGPVWKTVAFQ